VTLYFVCDSAQALALQPNLCMSLVEFCVLFTNLFYLVLSLDTMCVFSFALYQLLVCSQDESLGVDSFSAWVLFPSLLSKALYTCFFKLNNFYLFLYQRFGTFVIFFSLALALLLLCSCSFNLRVSGL